MLEKLAKFLFKVDYPYSQIIDRQRAQHLVIIIWLLLVITAISPVMTLLDNAPARQVVRIGSIVLNRADGLAVTTWVLRAFGFAALIWLVKTGRLLVASFIFTLMLLAFAVVTDVTSGARSVQQLLTFSLPIIAAGVLLNRRILVWVTIIEIGAVVALRLISLTGALDALAVNEATPLQALITSLLILLVDALLMGIFASGPQAMAREMNVLADEVHSLAVFNNIMLKSGNLDDILTQTVETIRDQFGFHHAQIFLVEDETNLVILRAVSGLDPVQIAATRKRVAPSETHVINTVVQEGKIKRLSMNDTADQRSEFLPTTRAGLLVPLRHGQAVIGVLDVQSVRPDAFSSEDMQVLEMVAAQLAVVIENNRLVIKLKESHRQRFRLEEQVQAGGLEGRRRDGSNENWSRLLKGKLDRVQGYDWSSGLIQSNPVLSDAHQRAFNNTEPETYEVNGEHMMTVPIVLRGAALGVIEFRAARGTGWTSRQIELARVISQRLALALDNLRLFEQAQLTATREQIASQLSARLQTRTDLDSLLALATDSFQEALGATRTNIRLDIPDNRQLIEETTGVFRVKNDDGGSATA
jgi:GAF domain-containing protein